jgi:uncharacterized protein YdaU (DUF1376 family)
VSYGDPAYQMYPRDWLASVSTCMTLEQEGAYIRLLQWSWLHDGLPNDPQQLRKLLRVTAKKFDAMWGVLRVHWHADPGQDGRLRNRRLEHERAERKRKSEARRTAGEKGNAVRWGSQCDPVAIPKGSPSPSPSPSPYPTPSVSTVQPPPVPPPSGEGGSPSESHGAGYGAEALFRVLAATPYRAKVRNRRAVLVDRAGELAGSGLDAETLRRLVAQARMESNGDWGALLAHWLDGNWRDAWGKIHGKDIRTLTGRRTR